MLSTKTEVITNELDIGNGLGDETWMSGITQNFFILACT